MRFIDQARLIPRRDWRKTWLIRQERIKKEGSEYFSYIVPVTIAGAISYIEIANQFPRAKKYEPLDWIEVVNNDAMALTLIINGNTHLPVPAGTIRTVDNSALWEIGIRNDGAINTTLNLILLTLRRQPVTIDDWARRGA